MKQTAFVWVRKREKQKRIEGKKKIVNSIDGNCRWNIEVTEMEFQTIELHARKK